MNKYTIFLSEGVGQQVNILDEKGLLTYPNIDEMIEWADVINVLRIQRERMGIGIIPSIREYRKSNTING